MVGAASVLRHVFSAKAFLVEPAIERKTYEGNYHSVALAQQAGSGFCYKVHHRNGCTASFPLKISI
jgi:hypothetical protein